MTYNIIAYGVYLLVTLYVIVVVGGALHKNGRVFVISCFHGNVSLADSINNLLLTGYYLMNAGYCIITLKIWKAIGSVQELTETLSSKIGLIVLLLGIMHLINIIALFITDKKYRNKKTNLIHN